MKATIKEIGSLIAYYEDIYKGSKEICKGTSTQALKEIDALEAIKVIQ